MENFIKIECCCCGVLFAVSSKLQGNFKKTKQDFYCPNGHGQNYTESTAEVLEKELKEERKDYLELRREHTKAQLEISLLKKKKIIKKKVKSKKK